MAANQLQSANGAEMTGTNLEIGSGRRKSDILQILIVQPTTKIKLSILRVSRRDLEPHRANTSFFNSWKLGVPSPVTGSQPSVAFQCAPGIIKLPGTARSLCGLIPPHPYEAPAVTSFSALNPFEYKNGFKNPRTGLPARRRASLRRPIIPANVGAAADVPPEAEVLPAATTW